MSNFTRDTKNTVEIKSFRPKSLTGEVVNDYAQVKEKFGSLASTDPKSNSHFNLHPAAKKNLGIDAEERSHLEDLVKAEVEKRVVQIKAQAFEEGFEKGRGEGKEKAEGDFFAIVQPLFEQFSSLLQSFDQAKQEIYNANEAFLIQLIYTIGKQVLLEDLKADPNYVKRLAQQIVEKLGAKENIRIKVSRQDYANIEQLREFLKAQFPDLKNVQIDASDDLVLGGCKIETDLSRVNASVESQLLSIQAALGDV